MKLTAELRQSIIANPKYMNIGGLPSEYIPYEFKELFIRPFTGAELKLISRAAATQDIEPLLRAIDLTMDQSVLDLTLGDFYYVMMWLRTYSYPKTPYIVEWECPEMVRRGVGADDKPGEIIPNDSDVDLKEDEYTVEACGTSNVETIHVTQLETLSLDEDFVLPEGLDFPRVAILKDLEQYLKDPDYQFIIPAAQWIPGATLKDKLLALEATEDLDLYSRANEAAKTIIHGVKEHSTLTCRKCRSKHYYRVELEPLSFFL